MPGNNQRVELGVLRRANEAADRGPRRPEVRVYSLL
jgi:hypothetical protein